MKVLINGDSQELRDGALLADAVDASGAHESRRGVAVAVDGEVVPRGDWDSTSLQEGQKVEVLHAVQGG